MSRFVFLAHHHDDRDQVKGFILLRWNKNVDFSFFDRSLVDPVKSKDADYIKRCIRESMTGTSVTIVLLGAKTASSAWVDWEIEESIDRRNGLLGICLKNQESAPTPALLTRHRAQIIGWNTAEFELAIEEAAVAAGR